MPLESHAADMMDGMSTHAVLVVLPFVAGESMMQLHCMHHQQHMVASRFHSVCSNIMPHGKVVLFQHFLNLPPSFLCLFFPALQLFIFKDSTYYWILQRML